MKKQITKYGLAVGIFLAAELIVTFSLIDKAKHDMSGGLILGFSMQVLAFLTGMWLALKSYRKEVEIVKPLPAIGLCAAIAVVGSIFYVLGWAFTYKFIFPDFKEWMMNMYQSQVDAGKATQAEYTEMVSSMKNYDSPVVFTLYTLMEVLPTGLLLSVIIAPIFAFRSRKKGR